MTRLLRITGKAEGHSYSYVTQTGNRTHSYDNTTLVYISYGGSTRDAPLGAGVCNHCKCQYFPPVYYSSTHDHREEKHVVYTPYLGCFRGVFTPYIRYLCTHLSSMGKDPLS